MVEGRTRRNPWASLTEEQRAERIAHLRAKAAEQWSDPAKREAARVAALAYWTPERKAQAKATAERLWTPERRTAARRAAIERNGGTYAPWTLEPGKRVGHLELVAEYDPSFEGDPYDAKWICRCMAPVEGGEPCLTLTVVKASRLLAKRPTRSCGCRSVAGTRQQVKRYQARLAYLESRRPEAYARHLDAKAKLASRGLK